MKKAVFFDADGTICDIQKGIPDSAVRAVRQLTSNGHMAFLCTGRSRAFVTKELEEMGFTGIIAACGSYIEYQGQRVFNRQMPPEIAEKSVKILRNCGMVPVMEGADYMYYDKEEYDDSVDWYASLITKALGSRWRPIKVNLSSMEINKISAKILPGSNPEAACRQLSAWYDAIHHEGSFVGTTIEFIPKGFSKALGIQVICQTLEIPWEDTVCFGDSNNDLAMFQYVHTKVAMGNASQPIKELADYITNDMFHYGIRNGLERLQLI